MSDHINGIKSRPYRKEIIDTLQKPVKGMSAYKEFVFFVKCVRDYHLADFEKGRPDLAVIGSGIPEELVLASGKRPYWILAGSMVNSMWADDADIPKEGHRKHPPGIPGCTEAVQKSGKRSGHCVSWFPQSWSMLQELSLCACVPAAIRHNSIGDDYIPRDACPLVKAVMGFGQTGALPASNN